MHAISRISTSNRSNTASSRACKTGRILRFTATCVRDCSRRIGRVTVQSAEEILANDDDGARIFELADYAQQARFARARWAPIHPVRSTVVARQRWRIT